MASSPCVCDDSRARGEVARLRGRSRAALTRVSHVRSPPRQHRPLGPRAARRRVERVDVGAQAGFVPSRPPSGPPRRSEHRHGRGRRADVGRIAPNAVRSYAKLRVKNFASVWRASRAPRRRCPEPVPASSEQDGRAEERGGALNLRLEPARLADNVVVEVTAAAAAVVIAHTSAPVVIPLVARSLRLRSRVPSSSWSTLARARAARSALSALSPPPPRPSLTP